MSSPASATPTRPLKRSLCSTTRPITPPPPRHRKKLRSTEHVASACLPSDPAPTRDISGQFRIFSWNVNGIGPLLQKPLSFGPDPLSPMRSFLKRHAWPSFLCLQEVKISPRDTAAPRQLQHAANQGRNGEEPTYTVHLSLPRDKYNATGFGCKIHGVASLIRDDYAPLIRVTRRPDWDLEGRVLIHEMEMGLVVINGYWVNGTSNPYRDSQTGLVTGTRHDHKLRFHQRMMEEVLQLQNKSLPVIMIGDMNVARARIDGHPNLRTSPVQHVKNRADFNAKFFTGESGMHGIDAFRHFHGELKKFTYYPRRISWGSSCDRVDLIIVSPVLINELGAVIDADICDNALDRGHSDHVPLWISVDLLKIDPGEHGDQESTVSAA